MVSAPWLFKTVRTKIQKLLFAPTSLYRPETSNLQLDTVSDRRLS